MHILYILPFQYRAELTDWWTDWLFCCETGFTTTRGNLLCYQALTFNYRANLLSEVFWKQKQKEQLNKKHKPKHSEALSEISKIYLPLNMLPLQVRDQGTLFRLGKLLTWGFISVWHKVFRTQVSLNHRPRIRLLQPRSNLNIKEDSERSDPV